MDKHDPSFQIKDRYSFEELCKIIAFLRGPEGCPWDRKQTHESLRSTMIEEAWEVVDAINSGRPERLMDELGDVLLQVVFHARMAAEEGSFTIDDVIAGLSRKMISRHTHLFGDDHAETPEEVLKTWEQNKMKEKGLENETAALREVPKSLPALTRAYKIQKRAANCGFDWADVSGAEQKITEETQELLSLAHDDSAKDKPGYREHLEEEAGDLLFAVVNTLRHLKIDPEIALTKAGDKFTNRFAKVEEKAEAEGRRLREMDLAEMDKLWDLVKEEEKERNEHATR